MQKLQKLRMVETAPPNAVKSETRPLHCKTSIALYECYLLVNMGCYNCSLSQSCLVNSTYLPSPKAKHNRIGHRPICTAKRYTIRISSNSTTCYTSKATSYCSRCCKTDIFEVVVTRIFMARYYGVTAASTSCNMLWIVEWFHLQLQYTCRFNALEE